MGSQATVLWSRTMTISNLEYRIKCISYGNSNKYPSTQYEECCIYTTTERVCVLFRFSEFEARNVVRNLLFFKVHVLSTVTEHRVNVCT